MISTKQFNDIPATIIHRITGNISAEEAEKGINESARVFETAIQKHGMINIIIDNRGIKFTDMLAHKTWSQGIKNHPSNLKEKTNYILIILDDSPNARAEKELMETEKLKFFFDFDEGIHWLKHNLL